MARKTSLTDIVRTADAIDAPLSLPQNMDVWYRFLRQVGTLYGTARDGLREFVSNAYDAGATEVTVTLDTAGKNKRIVVEDNGTGMWLPDDERKFVPQATLSLPEGVSIDDASILRLPKSIGDSAKRMHADVQGEKALGTLGFQEVGNRVGFFSRKDGNVPVGYVCAYVPRDGEPWYDAQVLQRVDDAHAPQGHGTRVIIEDLLDEALRMFKPSSLQKELGSTFSGVLTTDPDEVAPKSKMVLKIRCGSKEYAVAPEEYQGIDEILDQTVDVPGHGKIQIYLRGSPVKRDVGIHVHQGIQKLLDDLGRKAKVLGSDAWNSGYFTGKVRADWVTPNAPRNDIAADEKSKAFYAALREFNPVLEEHVKRYRSEREDGSQQKDFYTRLESAVRDAVRNDRSLLDMLSGRMVTKKGELVDGGEADQGFGTGQTLPDGEERGGGGGGSGGGTSGTQGEGRPRDQNKSGKVNTRKSFTLAFYERPLDGKLSEFEDEFGPAIVFNNIADAYVRANRADPLVRVQYFTGLIAKEIYSNLVGIRDPAELADRIVEFQQMMAGQYLDVLK